MSLITIITRRTLGQVEQGQNATPAEPVPTVINDLVQASNDYFADETANTNKTTEVTDYGIITRATPKLTGVPTHFGLTAAEAMRVYRTLYSYGSLLACSYGVFLEDVFNIGKGRIKWFEPPFLLSWLASDVELSLGSMETDSYKAGSYQMNYVTEQSSDTMSVTFIETKNADIIKSYEACKKLATPKDGTVNEPAKYAFKLTVMLFNERRNLKNPVHKKNFIVGVKEASVSLQSSGRDEIVKVQVTFSKLAPYALFE